MKHTVEIPLYHGYLVIHQVDDFMPIINEYNLNRDAMDSEGFTFIAEPGDSPIEHHVVFKNNYLRHNHICHELFHLVCQIFKVRGADLDIENEEPACYLQGWLADEIYGVVTLNDGQND